MLCVLEWYFKPQHYKKNSNLGVRFDDFILNPQNQGFLTTRKLVQKVELFGHILLKQVWSFPLLGWGRLSRNQ